MWITKLKTIYKNTRYKNSVKFELAHRLNRPIVPDRVTGTIPTVVPEEKIRLES